MKTHNFYWVAKGFTISSIEYVSRRVVRKVRDRTEDLHEEMTRRKKQIRKNFLTLLFACHFAGVYTYHCSPRAHAFLIPSPAVSNIRTLFV